MSMPTGNVSRRRNNGAAPPNRVKRSGAAATIMLTGNRSNDHFLIQLEGDPVALTHATLKALVKLIIARGSPGSGFVHVPRVTIHRLRQSLGREAGDKLIETGCGEEYRLVFEPDCLADHIVLHPSFFELGDLHVYSASQLEVLTRICPTMA